MKMFFRSMAGQTAIAALLAVTAVSAQAAGDEKKGAGGDGDSVFTLGRIETAGKLDKQTSPAVTTVNEDDMLLFDRKTVSEAANLIPGVSLTKSGGRNESMISVRGFDLKHAPLFMDGIPIYVPYDGYPDLGRFFTYDLSELNVSKGFASVLYGSNTMGGAVNMVSKRPSKTFEGNAGAGYTSGDTYHAFANLGTNQKRWYLQGGGSWVDSHSFTLSDDFKPAKAENGDRRENSYQRDGKITAKLGLTPNATDEYALSYIFQHGEKGVPPYAGSNAATNPKYWRWPYWDKQSIYLTTNTAIGGKSYVKSRLYYDQFQNSLHIFADATYSKINSGGKSWYNDYTYGGSLEAGTSLVPYNTFKAAFHFKDDVHREQTDASPQQRYEDRMYSISVEDTIRFTKALSAIIGVSYDIQDTAEAQDYNPLNPNKPKDPKVLHDLPTDGAAAANPQATLIYAFSDTGKIHASFAMKSRFASIKDKYSYKFGTYIPNPDLKAEESFNYEIGYQDTFAGRLKVKTAAFFNAVNNYIQAAAITANVSQNRHIGRVNRYGYELELAASPMETLETGANYTYIHNDNRSNSQKITDVPMHKAFVYVRYTPVTPLSFLASLEYDTKRYSSSDGKNVAGEFVIVNTKIGYEAVRGLTLEGGVNNLLDRNYALTEGYPEAGRTYFVQARYRF